MNIHLALMTFLKYYFLIMQLFTFVAPPIETRAPNIVKRTFGCK